MFPARTRIISKKAFLGIPSPKTNKYEVLKAGKLLYNAQSKPLGPIHATSNPISDVSTGV